MSEQQETVDQDDIRKALAAWEGSAHEHGIDLGGRRPVQESGRSGLSQKRQPMRRSANRDFPGRRVAQEQADRLTLEMTLNDIEQGGKFVAKSIYEMGRPSSADRFAALMQEALRIAEEVLF